jgi:hypothetical protein
MADHPTSMELLDHVTTLRDAVARLEAIADQSPKGPLSVAEISATLQFKLCLNLIDNLAWVIQGSMLAADGLSAVSGPPREMYR